MRLGWLIGMATLLAAPALAQVPDCPIRLGGSEMDGASRECFVSLLKVNDHPLEQSKTVSTMVVINIEKAGDFKTDEGFLLAQDKATGQWLYSALFYAESLEMLQLRRVNFGSPLRSLPMVSSDLSHRCDPRPCLRLEHAAAVLSPEDVQAILDGDRLTAYRIITDSGRRIDGYFIRSELEAALVVAGLSDAFRLQPDTASPPVDPDLSPSERRRLAAQQSN